LKIAGRFQVSSNTKTGKKISDQPPSLSAVVS